VGSNLNAHNHTPYEYLVLIHLPATPILTKIDQRIIKYDIILTELKKYSMYFNIEL